MNKRGSKPEQSAPLKSDSNSYSSIKQASKSLARSSTHVLECNPVLGVG